MNELSDKVTIKVTCPKCGKIYKVRVYPEDWEDYQNGKLVQDAFPYLSADERELLISKICPDCWDKLFGRWE